MTTHTLHATTPQLLKATAAAAVIAAAVLVSAVLPAEYGIDPTGIGGALGLTALHAANMPAETEVLLPKAGANAAAEPVIAFDVPYRNGEMTLTLAPSEGAEIKAKMLEGESLVFSWTSSGPVSFDMHGDHMDGTDAFTSYWKDRDQTAAHGSLVAPFKGAHGWYWHNKGATPVTVTVKASGYFEALYRP